MTKQPKTKRITVSVTDRIDAVRKHLQEEHGIEYTYVQLLDFLIHFYYKRAVPPKTEWRT